MRTKKVIPFQPKNEEPLWKMLFDHVKEADIGILFKYGQLADAIGESDKNLICQTARYTNKHLLKDCNKMLINERGIGYRIAHPTEQLGHAALRGRKAKRQLRWGSFELENLNSDSLSADEKRRLVFLVNHFQQGLGILRKRSMKAVEKAVKSVDEQVASLSKIDQMMVELEALKNQFKKE